MVFSACTFGFGNHYVIDVHPYAQSIGYLTFMGIEWIFYIQDLQATNIILDPGMAFGTGEHPTTKLCLMLLHRLLHGGELLLDYGTGSGILGIAAIKVWFIRMHMFFRHSV